MEKRELQDSIYNRILGGYTKGFVNNKNIDSLKSTKIVTVPIGMEYRPDLLAEYYLGDSNYGWAILLANRLENGIQDLYAGKKIMIPKIF